MGEPVILAVIGAIQVISVAIVGGYFARDNRRRKETEGEIMLLLDLSAAHISMGIATALAVRDGGHGDILAKGIAGAESALMAYRKYMIEIGKQPPTGETGVSLGAIRNRVHKIP